MDDKINKWLLQYDAIKELAETIHSEELPDETEALALQRSGVEELPLQYIGESGWYRQYQYALLLNSNSEDDDQRIDNLDWLDNLSDWLEKQNRLRNFPELEDYNREVKKVSCANAITFETSEDGSESTYYIQLYFNIKGGI